jgi:para-nitrobenzyl esterase
MAKKGMVVVAIQYRLGIFGFLASSALSGIHREEGKGNYGIEDQIAALRWTVENIRVFYRLTEGFRQLPRPIPAYASVHC